MRTSGFHLLWHLLHLDTVIQSFSKVLSFSLGSTASVAPVTPGGLGTRDKVIEVLLQSFGVDPSAASLTPILYSIALMFPAVIGIGFFLLDMKGAEKQS